MKTKCDKCGYDWSNSGDSAHVCGPINHTVKMSEEENQRLHAAIMDKMRSMKPPKFMEWWEVENTGWSGGISWFKVGGTTANPYRPKDEEEAIHYIKLNKDKDSDTKWRVVHVTLEREDNKEVRTRTWKEV